MGQETNKAITISSDKNENYNGDGNFYVIDIVDLLTVLWRNKFIIVGSIFFTSVIAIYFALSMNNIYRSEVLLAPANSDGKGLGGIASQFGGLASLAGVSLPSGGGSKTDLGIEVLKSREFFNKFVEQNDVLVPLIAASAWDKDTNQLIIDDTKYDTTRSVWVRKPVGIRKTIPTTQEAHELFLKVLNVSQEQETGFVTISVQHVSPYVARDWVDALVKELNSNIKQQDVEDAQNSISYLREQLKTTTIAELRTGLYNLIQKQTETIMLANASPEYLFRTIDPAVVPELKFGPNRKLICIIGAFIGLVLGMVAVGIKELLTRNFANKKSQGN